MKRTLFEIGDDAMALDALLDEIDGDISDPATAEVIDGWLSENSEMLDRKIDNYCALINENEARACAMKLEQERIELLAAGYRRKANALKERLKYFFERQGWQKLNTDRFKLTIAQNGGRQAVTYLVPPEELPEEYRREEVVIKPLTETIREDLERGEQLPFAQLEPRGSHLRIK